MTDRTHDSDSANPSLAPLAEDVGQLVRLAGSRPRMAAARVDRMQQELWPLWDSEVERGEPRSSLRLVAAAALVVLAVAAAFLTRGLWFDGDVAFATVARLEGQVSGWSRASGDAAADLEPAAVLYTGLSVATGLDGRAALLTATGHSLRLDRDTRIFLEAEHEVRLEQGAVYVDSGAGVEPGEGLSVLTPFGRVEEIGTQFEVRLTADTLTVRVREGEIRVGAEGRVHRALAGEQLALSGAGLRRSAIVAHDPRFDWVQGIVPAWPIDGSPLGDFLSWAARESGLELVYAEGGLAGKAAAVLLRGEIEGLTPREALEAVLPAVGLAHYVDGGTLSISSLAGQGEL